jgi:hypothetical protein
MSDLRLEGRLGVEMISPLRGCCVDTMTKWRPANVGEKHKCMYCENTLKTIRAGDAPAVEYSGMMNETQNAAATPAFSVSAFWFSKHRFAEESKVTKWCDERGLQSKITKSEDMAFCVNVDNIVSGTERAVWAAPGVLAIVGISKMGMGDMGSGGQLNPLQQGAACDVASAAKEEKVESETETEPVAKSVLDFNAALEKIFN